jgi:hypothetical protein
MLFGGTIAVYLLIHKKTYIFNSNSIKLRIVGKATSYVATYELRSISWNTNVHYRIHKSPPLVPILSQTNPLHTTSSYLSKIHINTY